MENKELPRRQNLKASEVGTFLRVSIRQVYNLVEKGSFPHVRVGRLLRVPRDSFLVWYREQQGSNK